MTNQFNNRTRKLQAMPSPNPGICLPFLPFFLSLSFSPSFICFSFLPSFFCLSFLLSYVFPSSLLSSVFPSSSFLLSFLPPSFLFAISLLPRSSCPLCCFSLRLSPIPLLFLSRFLPTTPSFSSIYVPPLTYLSPLSLTHFFLPPPFPHYLPPSHHLPFTSPISLISPSSPPSSSFPPPSSFPCVHSTGWADFIK